MQSSAAIRIKIGLAALCRKPCVGKVNIFRLAVVVFLQAYDESMKYEQERMESQFQKTIKILIEKHNI